MRGDGRPAEAMRGAAGAAPRAGGGGEAGKVSPHPRAAAEPGEKRA